MIGRDFCFYTKKLQKNFRSESPINIDFLKIIYIFLYFSS